MKRHGQMGEQKARKAVGRKHLRPNGVGGEAGPVLFVVNVDWFFLSHRLPLALAMKDKGYEVWVATIDTGRCDEISRHGLRTVALPMTRQGVGPREQICLLFFLARLYRRLRPRLVHHVAVKPVIWGSIAARVARTPAVVNSITGFGYLGGTGRRARLLQLPLFVLYGLALRYPRAVTILQNPEDCEEFVRRRLVREKQVRLIRGSGVDCSRFVGLPEPGGPLLIVFASRMLWEKGPADFVAAARIVKDLEPAVRFVIVGAPDDGNPRSVPEAQLRAWDRDGVVEWWGNREDMPEVLSAASVVALPTYYREGLPKILVEAAASARPIIATDIPGCREVVRHDVNGLLVPPRDPEAIAAGIMRLLGDPALRRRLGEAGRQLALQEFALETIVDQTLAVYSVQMGASIEARHHHHQRGAGSR